ncbi:MAG TPA: SRPBCC domain-containing protein [Terriglobales bacterium]|nr:SRPBCC domain-containing protein [Terriglobales bacterium]
MATAQVTPDNDVVMAEIFIAAPPARVFEAITDPKQTAQWWGQKGMYRLTNTHADVRLGGKWFSEGVGQDGKQFRVEGEYIEIDPPRKLVHTWIPSYTSGLKTVVRWELEPRDVHGLQHQGPARVGMGTLVKIHHSGLAGNEQAARSHGEGWKRVLGWVRGFVEKGETVDTRVA